MTDYKVISTRVSELTEVRIYAETIKHVEEEHPEIPANLPCIQAAVERGLIDPTQVERSFGDSLVYMDASSTNASGDPLRIPVKRIEGTSSGRVKTFYFAEPPTKADVIYRRGE